MPRAPRIEYEGALYHVMCRGDRREAIFRGDQDREMFLQTLGESCERAGLVVHSYVLMSNHYHLLLETPAGNLVAGMQWLQSTYTARFNARERKGGHVFQGRYKAVVIDSGESEYGRTVSDYIHLNPARAEIVNQENPRLKDYRWSSFPTICRGEGKTGWLQIDKVLSWHHWEWRRRKDRRAYEAYLQRRAKECWNKEAGTDSEFEELRRGWFLGGEEFREKLETLAAKVVKDRKRESYSSSALRRHDEVQAARLLEAGLKKLGLTQEEARHLRQNDLRKQGLMWLVKSRTVVKDAWLQGELDTGDRSNISRAVAAYRKASDRRVNRLRAILHKCTG